MNNASILLSWLCGRGYRKNWNLTDIYNEARKLYAQHENKLINKRFYLEVFLNRMIAMEFISGRKMGNLSEFVIDEYSRVKQ